MPLITLEGPWSTSASLVLNIDEMCSYLYDTILLANQ